MPSFAFILKAAGVTAALMLGLNTLQASVPSLRSLLRNPAIFKGN